MKISVFLCLECSVDVFGGFGANFTKRIVQMTGERCRRCSVQIARRSR